MIVQKGLQALPECVLLCLFSLRPVRVREPHDRALDAVKSATLINKTTSRGRIGSAPRQQKAAPPWKIILMVRKLFAKESRVTRLKVRVLHLPLKPLKATFTETRNVAKLPTVRRTETSLLPAPPSPRICGECRRTRPTHGFRRGIPFLNRYGVQRAAAG